MAGGAYSNPDKLKKEVTLEARAVAKGASGKAHNTNDVAR